MTEKYLLTLSGPPKSGTSSTATHLANTFDVAYVNGGDVFRALANQRDMSLSEFSKYVNNHPEVDKEIDAGLEQIATSFLDQTHAIPDLPALDIDWSAPTLVLESRLAGWLTHDYADLNVWLHAPIETRVDRAVNKRDIEDVTVVREQLTEREQDETMRYDKQYDIDITDTSPYDVVINTEDLTVAETARIIQEHAVNKDSMILQSKPKQTKDTSN